MPGYSTNRQDTYVVVSSTIGASMAVMSVGTKFVLINMAHLGRSKTLLRSTSTYEGNGGGLEHGRCNREETQFGLIITSEKYATGNLRRIAIYAKLYTDHFSAREMRNYRGPKRAEINRQLWILLVSIVWDLASTQLPDIRDHDICSSNDTSLYSRLHHVSCILSELLL